MAWFVADFALGRLTDGQVERRLRTLVKNYLYIRLFLSDCGGLALLGNSRAIARQSRLATTTQEHPRC